MSNLYYDAGGEPADGRKVMLATTAYDSPDASHTYAIARTREVMHQAGLPSAYLLLQGNCHVDDARNKVVRDFLASDCSELVFLDADVSWEPEQLVDLCGSDHFVIGGVYPYRRETGKEGMPVRNLAGHHRPDENGLLEVAGLPTGFLRIRRAVLERLAAASVMVSDREGHARDIPLIFERTISETGGRIGGDINFCMRWRQMGGRVFAAANLRLGHCGKHVIRDSLAASLRRQAGLSLPWVCERIRDGQETLDDLHEARKAINNPWATEADFLRLAVGMVRSANGPIIEAGSGLTTLLMAAARPDLRIYCTEHDPLWLHHLENWGVACGLRNITTLFVPIRDGWYALGDEEQAALPDSFAMGVVDGPPRLLGDRMRFFDEFGDRTTAILCDDADDAGYLAKLRGWADAQGRGVEHDGKRPAVILPAGFQKAA